MLYDFSDKDKLKESLTIEDVFRYVEELGGEPIMHNGYFVSSTICHNLPGEGSHKLWYYENTHLFKCFTGCEDNHAFDIYELTVKTKKQAGEKNITLFQAFIYVAQYFGFHSAVKEKTNTNILLDWNILNRYQLEGELINKQIIELKHYDDSILNNFSHLRIAPWEAEGIKQEIMEKRGIVYNPSTESIVIPHYDIDNNLIGIRERTLIEENEIYGKYHPLKVNQTIYKHPISFNLYNLNNSKDNIKRMSRCIVLEGEKGCLKYASYFGEDSDISVACCGSSLIEYQVQLLLDLGVKEIIIAFDKQFKELGDKEFVKWTNKLKNIHNKYKNLVTISFMFDKWGLLDYKDSPIDKTPEVFLQLFKERIYL